LNTDAPETCFAHMAGDGFGHSCPFGEWIFISAFRG
jgi:hypothetical protein